MIKSVHTLGPTNTNCEKAALSWITKNELDAEVFLYDTLEIAAEKMTNFDDAVLLSCIVYPKLHELVFQNLHNMQLVDCFIEPTYNMVLAQRKKGNQVTRIFSHPAPIALLEQTPYSREIVEFVNSNAAAANSCLGETDACITTIIAANENNLHLVKDFGPVPMGFAIHALTK